MSKTEIQLEKINAPPLLANLAEYIHNYYMTHNRHKKALFIITQAEPRNQSAASKESWQNR